MCGRAIEWDDAVQQELVESQTNVIDSRKPGWNRSRREHRALGTRADAVRHMMDVSEAF